MKKTPAILRKCYAFTQAADAREQGIYPFFHPIERTEGTRAIIDGREVIMAGSNNYLGLSFDQRVKEAAVKAIEKYGISCSGSRFMNGTLVLHEELEAKMAQFRKKRCHLLYYRVSDQCRCNFRFGRQKGAYTH